MQPCVVAVYLVSFPRAVTFLHKNIAQVFPGGYRTSAVVVLRFANEASFCLISAEQDCCVREHRARLLTPMRVVFALRMRTSSSLVKVKGTSLTAGLDKTELANASSVKKPVARQGITVDADHERRYRGWLSTGEERRAQGRCMRAKRRPSCFRKCKRQSKQEKTFSRTKIRGFKQSTDDESELNLYAVPCCHANLPDIACIPSRLFAERV